ncbi:M23 family metallopeptidase [Alteromonas portus]|uniref:M23 family metallopeptidase n=1 Tax=Alteromonas portus TaxID=2565549 RepID=UPI00196B13F1|nr:M23 family metallopeptidase [Alteromonas portus]
MKKTIISILLIVLVFICAGLVIPEKLVIPVEGASSNDWNHNTFWYEPWGSSGVHKGVDIFGVKGTPVQSATSGYVIYTGELGKGGNVVAVLGPKWRVHYYAHMQEVTVEKGTWLSQKDKVGTLGDTGNAKGKQPHLHYSIVSLIPLPWKATSETQGWKKMFFLNPHEKLL